jgi:acetolactate synthase-1/2/3 large subunit
MNGAESLVRTLLAAGVDTCFANPGTSEMHFVAALDRVPGMRCILAMFEGVATGAADGYARMAGKPAASLLHCGPGLANGLANLHNARRGHVPLVNITGDQATYHKPLAPPLAADTEAFARGVSDWVRTAVAADEVGRLAAEAVQAALTPPGQVATLILPSDASWNEGGAAAAPLPAPEPATVDEDTITEVARILASREPAVILLGGRALRAPALADAHRIAAASGAVLLAECFNTRMERGAGRHPIGRVPYAIDAALATFAGCRHVILVEAADPVSFFAYPGKRGQLRPPDAAPHVLARHGEDSADALARLAERLGAPPVPPPSAPRPQPARGAVTPEAFAHTLSALLPDDAVVVDESITFGFGVFPATTGAAPHDWLQLTGGAIGDGLPMATGAAVGVPGRRVVNLQADGSALYTVQALWTQARERLAVTTVILSNRRYAILQGELQQVGATPGEASRTLFDLGRPDLDWVGIARGFGVDGARAETMDAFADLFAHANRTPGPFLIELVVP